MLIPSSARFTCSGCCILADIKNTQFFSDIDDKDYNHEAFRWWRGEFFWLIRAKLGLACAQAATMRSKVVGQSLRGSTRAPYHGFGLYRPRF